MAISSTCSEVARHYLCLSMAEGVGPITFDRLVQRFGGAEAILKAPRAALREVEGVGERTAEAIVAASRSDAWKDEVSLAETLGVRILCREDGDYPKPLMFIPDPPICLYAMGQLRREDALSIAIVGSRQASMYGLEQAQRFAELLSQAGLAVISGMARGIDQAAHLAALRMGGRTIAVLGCGLSHCYPPESVELRDRIAGSGAIVSELPMQTGPQAGNFPRRNRIIAGLSLGTLVVEAAPRSGALITARLANEYNREVFALPGRVDTMQAEGTNDLIRNGCAKLVTNLADILEELGEAGDLLTRQAADSVPGPAIAGTREPDASDHAGNQAATGHDAPSLNGPQAAIYRVLTAEPMHIDQVAAAANLAVAPASAALTLLQLRGLVRQLPGNLFVRRG